MNARDPLGRPPRLTPVPAPLSARQMAASTPFLRLLRGGRDGQALDRILHAINNLPDDMRPGDNLHRVHVDEDGLTVHDCIVCNGLHHSLWDRVVVGNGHTLGDQIHSYVATWDCPNQPGTKVQHILTREDFADAIEGGAELMDDVADDAVIIRFDAWVRHPALTAEAFARYRAPAGDEPEGGDAA